MKKKIVPDPPFPLPKTPYLFAHNNITPLAALAQVEALTRGMVVHKLLGAADYLAHLAKALMNDIEIARNRAR
ncbi:hypothetical protein IAE37_003114 [Pseudomonas sp. S31]|uniref:hypothetical protein n=1 Tax=Pseudomonas sp. S31 TaxID=1564473 RepID=UPI0019134E12|nr:hypothetical protein [Pseudomonas sp. S31]MBK5000838.1 hypothetical protein [Pseudomonas sp. S31]